jgi:hypothetical protein
MRLCDLLVEGLADFPTLDAVEAFAEFLDYSSALSHAASGLGTD